MLCNQVLEPANQVTRQVAFLSSSLKSAQALRGRSEQSHQRNDGASSKSASTEIGVDLRLWATHLEAANKLLVGVSMVQGFLSGFPHDRIVVYLGAPTFMETLVWMRTNRPRSPKERAAEITKP